MILQIENMRQRKVIISGGGSGGHIFPAVAIAKSMKEKEDNIDFTSDTSSEYEGIDYKQIIQKELEKIKEFIDLDLITQDQYVSRKAVILEQIIDTNIPERAIFILELVKEELITQDDFEYIFNKISTKDVSQ